MLHPQNGSCKRKMGCCNCKTVVASANRLAASAKWDVVTANRLVAIVKWDVAVVKCLGSLIVCDPDERSGQVVAIILKG